MPYDVTHAIQNTVPIFTATTHRHHKTKRQTDISCTRKSKKKNLVPSPTKLSHIIRYLQHSSSPLTYMFLVNVCNSQYFVRVHHWILYSSNTMNSSSMSTCIETICDGISRNPPYTSEFAVPLRVTPTKQPSIFSEIEPKANWLDSLVLAILGMYT